MTRQKQEKKRAILLIDGQQLSYAAFERGFTRADLTKVPHWIGEKSNSVIVQRKYYWSVLAGFDPTRDDPFVEALKKRGFIPVRLVRTDESRADIVDQEINKDITRIYDTSEESRDIPDASMIILLSGDYDHYGTLKAAQEAGKEIIIVSTARQLAKDMKDFKVIYIEEMPDECFYSPLPPEDEVVQKAVQFDSPRPPQPPVVNNIFIFSNSDELPVILEKILSQTRGTRSD